MSKNMEDENNEVYREKKNSKSQNNCRIHKSLVKSILQYEFCIISFYLHYISICCQALLIETFAYYLEKKKVVLTFLKHQEYKNMSQLINFSKSLICVKISRNAFQLSPAIIISHSIKYISLYDSNTIEVYIDFDLKKSTFS